jgi:hypothetical protein
MARGLLPSLALMALAAGNVQAQTAALATGTSAPAAATASTAPQLLPPPVSTEGPAGSCCLGQPSARPDLGLGRRDLCLARPSPGPPACAPYEDYNGPLLKGSPLLDWPEWAPPGVFGAVELDIVGPHVKNRLMGPVSVNGGTDQVHTPAAALDWTVAPRFDLGWRFAQGAGELLVSYQFLTTAGTESLPGFDAANHAAAVHSRLDMQVLDLDFASREPAWLLGCNWDWKWRAGVRLAGIFFDARATSPLLEQRTANNFVGAGPDAGLELRRSFPGTGLAAFARVETALVVGSVHQSFEEAFTTPTGAVGGATSLRHSQPVPFLGLAAGVSWSPPQREQLRVTAGYILQNWWSAGDLAPDSRGDVTVQGIFVRGEWRY